MSKHLATVAANSSPFIWECQSITVGAVSLEISDVRDVHKGGRVVVECCVSSSHATISVVASVARVRLSAPGRRPSVVAVVFTIVI